MTTKQIAESVARTDRAVRGWVKDLAEKNAVVAEKLSASSPMAPADWSLEETLAIIAEGMGPEAAALYRDNATKEALPRVIILQPKLPPASQLRELRIMAADRTITPAQVQRALGFLPDPPAIEEPKATAEEAANKLGPVAEKIRAIASDAARGAA